MIAQHYKDMLGSKSVIRQISEWSTARGEIGYENVFDYSLGNPSVPCPPQFTTACEDLLPTPTRQSAWLYADADAAVHPQGRGRKPEPPVRHGLHRRPYLYDDGRGGCAGHAVRCVGVPGQNVVTFAPFFPEYKPYIEGAGLTLRVTPPRCADFQIDFEAFAQLVDENTAAVLINSPTTPAAPPTARPCSSWPTFDRDKRQIRPPHLPDFRRAVPRDFVRRQGHALPAKFYDDTLTCYSFSRV